MDAAYTGKQIQDHRKAKGWTQKDLAEKLRVTDKAVSKWERGLNYPDLSSLELLASALDTTVSSLLGLEDSSAGEILEAAAQISQAETDRLKREFRRRIWLSMAIEAVLLFSQIASSKIMADHQLYGTAQALTLGMVGWTGLLLGNGIYMLKKYKLLIDDSRNSPDF